MPKPMPSLVVAFLAVSLLASCLPDSRGGGVDWPKVANCGPGVDDVVSSVSRVLLDGSENDAEISDRAVHELEQLAAEHGADTVACLVDLLVSDWLRPGASPNPDRMAAAMRGQDFLRDVGTRIERSGEPGAQLILIRDFRWAWIGSSGFVPIDRGPADDRPRLALLAHTRSARA